MNRFKDLTGKKFGRLTVMSVANKKYKDRGVIWNCLCDCGNKVKVRERHLIDGGTRSCGCLMIEHTKIIQVKATNVDRFKGTKIGQLTRKISSSNSSGYKGINWDKKRSKWRVRLTLAGKEKHLGYFDKLEDAIECRKRAEEKYFKPIIEEYKKSSKILSVSF
jgi:hypothetical protein